MRVKLLLPLVLLLVLYSCKERIDVSLAENANKLVIEGEVHDGPGPYFVKLSRSTNYGNPVTFLPHTPQSVFISDNEGNRDSLIKYRNGIYKTTSIQGKAGNTYFLTVKDTSCIYSAVSKLNSLSEIDSFYVWTYLKNSNKKPAIVIKDPFNEKNFYRYYVRHKYQIEAPFQYVMNDEIVNGTSCTFSPTNEIYTSGDSIVFTLLAIDEANYKYWSTLVQNQTRISNGNNRPTPVNPKSNLIGCSDEILGYFSAHSRKTLKFKIP